jgi:ribosome assembly protein YihI (activator of Der GTPase)
MNALEREEYLDKLLETNDENELLNYGIQCFHSGSRDKSLPLLDKVLTINPNNQDAKRC